MTDKPKPGGYVYSEIIQSGRTKTKIARDALRKIVEENPGPQTLAMGITRVALVLGDIEAILSQLEQIGRDAKNKTGD